MPEWESIIRKRLEELRLDGVREAEIVEELTAHLDDRYRELITSGIPHHQAIEAAAGELNSSELVNARLRRASARAVLGVSGGSSIVESIWHDLKVAFRMIRMNPAFSAAVIGMLALGVAGNAAIFSIFNGLFLRPMPFADPSRLVDLNETAPKWNLKYVGVSNRDYADWQKGNRTFDGMAFLAGGGANLTTANGAAQRIRTNDVTFNLLDVLGLKPVLGRNFIPEEDRPGGAHVILLGYDLWQRLFNGDRGVVGQILKLDDVPHAVIGVLPRDAVLSDAEAWRPLAADPARFGWYLSGVGRLKYGVSIGQARDDLMRVHRSMVSTGRQVNEITSPTIVPLRERYLGDLKAVTHILLGAVGVVLLIACVNIAGLMLVRGEARSREIAIRTAVGASRARVIRQLLTESAVLAAGGGLLGVLAGKILLNGLISVMPENIPRWVRFDLDGRFALFCIAATAAAAILFGVVPALQAAGADARGCLQTTARSTLTRARRGVLRALVVGEIALALMLLISSGLLMQAFRKVLSVDPGFRPNNVMTFSLRLPSSKYPKFEQRLALLSGLVDRLKSVPGVAGVSAASIVPLDGHRGNFFEAEAGRQPGANEQNPVTLEIVALPGYFETMGIALLGGRGFHEEDQRSVAPEVAVVNETYARYFWGSTDVTGKRIRYSGRKDWMRVVGVVRDPRHYGLDGEMRPSVFVPFTTWAGPAMTIAMHGAVDAQTLVGPAREILRQLDPDLPMYDVHSMTERMEKSLWTRRAYSWLFAAFAGVAMILAAAGIYGVISFAVSQRTREIGIRIALGARPGQVMSGVLGNGMLLVAIGAGLGLIGSRLTARFLETLLFGVSNRDTVTYVAVILGVSIVGLLANYVPARRASEVDPMQALRAE